jgi:uncharacterized membrane protein YphA (DoxX/SURF4 family)
MVKRKNIKTSAPIWVWVARPLVGLLFIFSGLIKANDPLGFSYKLEEYFGVFHITFLDSLSLTLAIVLCALEMILGFALLIGLRSRQVAWGLLLLIIFFAFLTFYSAAFKVVQTCGCFGDAIPLTPWQSFSKDLILLLLILVLFKNRDSIKPIFTAKTGDRLLIVATILALGVGVYTYNYAPVFDFLSYKIGANIPGEMKTPAGAMPDEFEQTYHLKNKSTGATKTMTDKEYISSNIWKDNNWSVQGDVESRLVKKGFTPKIQDLLIQDAQRNDYTNELLSNPYYNLFVVAWDLNSANDAAMDNINTIAINLNEHYSVRTVLLTATSVHNAEAFKKAHNWVSEIFYVDEVPLKEMVRANPGVLLLKNGTIINKWHYHTLPTYDELVKQYFQQPQ